MGYRGRIRRGAILAWGRRMISPEMAIIVGILAPVVVACLVPILAIRSNWRDGAGIVGAIVTFYAAASVAMDVLAGGRPELHLVSLNENLEFAFRVHPLGAVFGLVASGLWTMATVYSIGYMRGNHERSQTRFAAFYAIAVSAAMAIAWSGNLLMLFVFYEILTFSTYPLVVHKESGVALKAGRLYLGILVGTSVMLLLPAMICVWLISGTLDFTEGGILRGYLSPAYAPWLLALFIFGTGKAAVMPMHRWLPAAMVAPAPVSALLHAVAVVKSGVFTVLVVVVYIFGSDFILETGASTWLVWVACFTILAASVIAMRQDDLKARLAYSTISQLSYIVLGAALASDLALQGAGLHIVMHASAKITLFFCAGAIYVSAHRTKVSEMNGLGYKMPYVFVAFSLAALSIIGIPPLGGAWSKFFLMAGAAETGSIMVIGVLAISSLLNVYYLLELVFRGFFMQQTGAIEVKRHILTVIPPVITAALSIILFFLPWPFADLVAMMGS